jgi:hypothetical protein
MQPALDASSGCDRTERCRFSGRDAQIGRHDDLSGVVQPAEVVRKQHVGSGDVDEPPVAADESHAVDQLADQPPAEMGVAEHRASQGSGRSGPRFEPADPAVDGPSHETIDRQTRIRADERDIERRDVTAVQPNDQPGHPLVGDEHVRASAERHDRHPGLYRDLDGLTHVLTAMQIHEPLGGTSHLEGGQRSQRNIAPDAPWAKCVLHSRFEARHREAPVRVASRCRSASIA